MGRPSLGRLQDVTDLKRARVLPGMSHDDCADWYISPGGYHRDSDLVAESNFTVITGMLDAVDPEGTDHEIRRFGHWAVGWVEEIIVRPDTECERIARECDCALADYPLMSDDHHSMLESERHAEGNCGEGCSECEYKADHDRGRCGGCSYCTAVREALPAFLAKRRDTRRKATPAPWTGQACQCIALIGAEQRAMTTEDSDV